MHSANEIYSRRTRYSYLHRHLPTDSALLLLSNPNNSRRVYFIGDDIAFASRPQRDLGDLPYIELSSNTSRLSIASAASDETEGVCRICRCNEANVKLIRCPCKCKGSVGYVHLNCLKQWMLHHRSSRCEICNSHYRLPVEQLTARKLIRSFFSYRCVGLIIKHLVLAVSVIPLARVVLHQVLILMDKINPDGSDELSINQILIASCALFTSSSLFFNFFDYVTRRLLVIKNVMRQWWMFGDLELMNPEIIRNH